MSPRRAKDPVWKPDGAELQLLRAGLWESGPALEAWHRWRAIGTDLDLIEHGSFRLLPLVYRNIGARLAEEGDPDAGRLKGIYRHSWTSNQMTIQAGLPGLQALAADGIPTMVLKGAALAHLHYDDAGCRPMADFDIAVPESRGAEAVEALRGAGYRPAAADVEQVLEVRHSEAFRGPGDRDVDLHVRIIWRPGLEQPLWEAAVPLQIRDQQTTGLCPTDQLLHACLHGAAWNPVSPVRWVADSYTVIATSPAEIDWQRLVELARRSRLTLALSHALRVLAREMEAAVPAETLAELEAIPVSTTERVAFRALAEPPSPRRAVALLWWLWDRYRAQAEAERRQASPLGFGRYVQGFWGLGRLREVPLEGARRLGGRLRSG